MKTREEFIIIALAGITINLAFMLGQIFYFDQRSNRITELPLINNTDLSGNLLNIDARKFSVIAAADEEITVPPEELKNWVENYVRNYYGNTEYRLNGESIANYLNGLAQKVSQLPVNAKLIFEDGRISQSSAPKLGKALDIPGSVANIELALVHGNQDSAQLAFSNVAPEITPERINNLGINELLGQGESNFVGSTKARIHNIGVGVNVFNGILVAPGQEFSFNKLLGPVVASTGYEPELVIKTNSIAKEYGGGLCQVSTTIFRAIAAAGLPILERHAHSLPVHYYNPQGFDATIYPGVSDFRFKNDTQAYVLIQSQVVGTKVIFEIYGTSDGRKIAIDGPHQYAAMPDGSLKAVLRRTVTYTDGTEKKDEFFSLYKSPSLFPLIRNPLE
jgi:vancomycin resistance protein YoaR